MDAITTIQEYGSLIKEANAHLKRLGSARKFDEIEVFSHLTRGNHTAAVMLRHLLRWGKGDEWVYMSAEDWEHQLAIKLSPLRSAKRVLKAIGVQIKVFRVKTESRYVVGVPTTHYKIDGAKLHGLLISFFAENGVKFDNSGCQKVTSPDDESSSAGCQKTSPPADESADSSITSSSTSSSSDSSSSSSLYEAAPEERDLIEIYSAHFGYCNGQTPGVVAEMRRLGIDQARRVLDRCKTSQTAQTEGVTWHYAFKALSSEATETLPPGSAAPPSLLEESGERYVSGEYADFIRR